MKNYKKILLPAIFTLLILAGCSQEAPNKIVEEKPLSKTNLNCNLLKNADTRKDCEGQVNEAISRLLESEIFSTFDASRCSELSGEATKKCQDGITATGVKGPVSAEETTLFNTVMRGNDPAKCAELKTSGYKEYCESRIAERAEREKFDGVIQANDLKGCDTLTTQPLKDECKMLLGGPSEPPTSPAEGEMIPPPPLSEEQPPVE